MFEKLDILSYLKERGSILNDNNLNNLPDEHKNTSLESGAKCDLSYHQGYRDGIQSLLTIINIDWQNEHDAMEEETEHMYLEHLRQRCADIYAKEEVMIDVSRMTKEHCITFLKDEGVWNK